MGKGAIFSALLHLAIVVIAIFGLPAIYRTVSVEDQPIPVEIVTIANRTAAPERPAPTVKKPPKPVTKPVVKPTPPRPVPKKMRVATAVPTPPEAAKLEAVKPEPIPKKAKSPAVAPKPAPRPKLKPSPPKKQVLKKTKPAKRAKKAKSQPDQWDSLLRNVEKMKAVQVKKAETEPEKKASPRPLAADPSKRMSISELHALRRQLYDCWIVPAGAREAKNLIVDIHVSVNPDGTVLNAKVADSGRMRADEFFRAAAESALRAVLRCSPLRLPPNKYEQWKTMTLTFDPKQALGT